MLQRVTRAVCLLAPLMSAVTTGQPAGPQSQRQPTFRAGVETVAVYATVQDADGRLVSDLTRDDFHVLDNGQPADITTF